MHDFGQIFVGQTLSGILGEHSKKCTCQNSVDFQSENDLFSKQTIICYVPN